MRRSTKKILWLLGVMVMIAIGILMYFFMEDSRTFEDKRDPVAKGTQQVRSPIVVAKVWIGWPEFSAKVAVTQDAAMCDTGQDKVLGWNEQYRVRCMAIATRNPAYCQYFDVQPNAEKKTPIFQQVCIYEVLRLSPRDMRFSPEVCNGIGQYPAFRFLYNECLAMVTRNANYCIANQDVPTPGSMPDGAEQSLQCLATLAAYTNSKQMCDLAKDYERIFLDDGRLDMPAGDILAGCPMPF